MIHLGSVCFIIHCPAACSQRRMCHTEQPAQLCRASSHVQCNSGSTQLVSFSSHETRFLYNTHCQLSWYVSIAYFYCILIVFQGYIKCQRNDAGIDPNRDFGYSRENTHCMLSTTAKIFHHLMAQNLIQVVVTFHSGMVAIGYEWGSKNHMKPQDASPDDKGNADIAAMMKHFGGSFKNEAAYPGMALVSL